LKLFIEENILARDPCLSVFNLSVVILFFISSRREVLFNGRAFFINNEKGFEVYNLEFSLFFISASLGFSSRIAGVGALENLLSLKGTGKS
jgi:hypothetical protein